MNTKTIKTCIYGYHHTLSTVLRLILNRQVAWGKTINIVTNTISCFFEGQPPHLPPVLQIDITNTCNLRCPGCLTGQGIYRQPPGMMSFDNFRALVDEVKKDTAMIALYNSGEPMRHPAVFDMVEYLTQNRIASIISTNGHFIDNRGTAARLVDSGLSLLIVSISGATQKTYETYHQGGDLKRVIESIRFISEAKKKKNKKTPLITLRILLTRDNANELPQMRALAKYLGCDTIDIRHAEWQKQVLNQQINDNAPSRPASKKTRNKVCLWPWLISVVNWNGGIIPCCFYHLELPDMGNAFNPGGIRHIWYSPAYSDFRKQMRQGKNSMPVCRDCPAETGFQTQFTRQGRH